MPQFCPVLSKETLLEQTLQRAALPVSRDRTPSLFALTSASAPPHHDRGDRTDAFTGRRGLSPAIRAQGPDQAMILCVRVRVSTLQEEPLWAHTRKPIARFNDSDVSRGDAARLI